MGLILDGFAKGSWLQLHRANKKAANTVGIRRSSRTCRWFLGCSGGQWGFDESDHCTKVGLAVRKDCIVANRHRATLKGVELIFARGAVHMVHIAKEGFEIFLIVAGRWDLNGHDRISWVEIEKLLFMLCLGDFHPEGSARWIDDSYFDGWHDLFLSAQIISTNAFICNFKIVAVTLASQRKASDASWMGNRKDAAERAACHLLNGYIAGGRRRLKWSCIVRDLLILLFVLPAFPKGHQNLASLVTEFGGLGRKRLNGLLCHNYSKWD